MTRIALTIAGSDGSGGAGIQADLKTFHTHGVHGLSVITSVTAQNSRGIVKAFDLPPAFVEAQLEALFADFKIIAVKTGMLSTAAIINAVFNVLKRQNARKLVVDPAMISKSGFRLLKRDATQQLKKTLLPLALLVTPNVPEAEVLSGVKIDSPKAMREAALETHKLGPMVLIKGGHAKFQPGIDLFYDGKRFHEIKGKYFANKTPHGTGCVYSAAVTALLAQGTPLLEAILEAKTFLEKSMRDLKNVGKGFPFL